MAGCSRQQSDWEKTRAANTVESYDQFLKQYPSGEFTAQAQARVKELNEEREWQKARDADTLDAYQAFIKQFPEGKWAEEARIRVENFTLAQAPSGAAAGAAPTPGGAANSGAGAAVAGAAAGAAAVVAAKPTAVKPPAVVKPAASKPSVVTKPKAAHHQADRYGVQLGAFSTGASAAHKRWAHLSKEYPVLAGLTPKVAAHKTASGPVYRLELLGLTKTKAREICKNLKTKSQPCVVLHP
jgi:cell division protein FtsN